MTGIPATLKALVIERANNHCEYCGVSGKIIIAMTIDHIKPESDAGTTTEDNLCRACHPCNESKREFQTGFDPETQQEHALFHPRKQEWREHFRWSEDYSTIIGLTPAGRATITRLKMNREEMVIARPEWRKIGWNPPG